METTYIDSFIDKHTHKLNSSNLSSTSIAWLIFNAFAFILALSFKNFFMLGLVIFISIAMIVYIAVVSKKKKATIYIATLSGVILILNQVISVNIIMYLILENSKIIDGIWFAIVLAVQLLSMIIGFLYSIKRIEKGLYISTCKGAIVPITLAMSGAIGKSLWSAVSNIEDINIKNFFYTLIFSGACAYFMYFLGMSYVAIFYCIKKYKIPNRELRSHIN